MIPEIPLEKSVDMESDIASEGAQDNAFIEPMRAAFPDKLPLQLN